MAAPIPHTPIAHRINGAAGTGKTQLLIHNVKNLVEQGASPDDIIVFGATPDSASMFRIRLADEAGVEAARVSVTTPRSYCLGILRSDDAAAYIGRDACLLADFEVNFLLEDLKVSGVRPKRLREMLKFFYRSWTELADDDPSWLMRGEETDVHALLKGLLAFNRSIIEPELANLAVNYLRDNSDAAKKHARKHVFVDDYQNISRASQVLANMLASESIAVAGSPTECIEVFESYPYSAGLEEFVLANSHALLTDLESSRLSKAVAAASNALLADESMGGISLPLQSDDAVAGSLVSIAYESARLEFEGIASLVAERLHSGAAAGDIFIVVPNQIWNTNVCSALEEQGLAVDSLPNDQLLKGDIREYDRCLPLRVFTALKLVADPENALAWRCWCGFGDYLTNSTAFSSIRKLAEEQGLGLIEALEAIGSGEYALDGTEKVITAYQTGKSLTAKVSELRGKALLNGIASLICGEAGHKAPEVLLSLCPDIAPEDTADDLVGRISRRLLAPRFAFADDAVKVASAAQACGLSPRTLIYSGFVNGFIPARDYFDSTQTPLEQQRKVHEKDNRILYTILGKATEELVFTYFTKTDLETAERLKLEIERIRLEKGKRMCTIGPSEFLGTIQAAQA